MSYAIVPSGAIGAAAAMKFLQEHQDDLPAEFELFVTYMEFFVTDNPRLNEATFAQVVLALLQWDYELEMVKQNQYSRIKITAELPKGHSRRAPRQWWHTERKQQAVVVERAITGGEQ